ncbi:retrotransposon protein, putative, ty1-copia subclass [Tanacetum coccineum]
MLCLTPDKYGVRDLQEETNMDGKYTPIKAVCSLKAAHSISMRLDYEETFSPVADIRAIRILIAIAAYYDYEIWQMNVKTTFLEWSLRLKTSIWETNLKAMIIHVCCQVHKPDVALLLRTWSVDINQNPGKLHWVTGFMMRPARQLKRWITKSQTGYVFVVNGGAVDWKSKKQTTIAMHATQSEYMAASEAAMKRLIRKFFEDLGVIYHYVREQVESGEIKLIKVHTDKNLADAFTKALPRGKVNEHANGIGLRLASSFMHICD